MKPEGYIKALEELASKLRDDDDLCNVDCDECALNKQVINQDEIYSYCDMLVDIHNSTIIE